MLSLTSLFVVLPVLVNAGFHDVLPHSTHHRKVARNSQSSKRSKNTTYEIDVMYQGEDFLNDWDFFSSSDPTNGNVNYLTKKQAVSADLAYVQDDGSTIIRVDNTTTLTGSNPMRDSVRITSQKTFNGGLFIADFYSMPHGCSTWPAYWTVGPNWPAGGEIDIIEGVNLGTTNQLTLHTSDGCTLDASTLRSDISSISSILGTQCATLNGDNSGCAFTVSDERSYGSGFNDEAGGVYATLWDSTGISMWFFSRCDIPDDIEAQNPDPTSWGTPVASFPFDDCSADHFYDHSIVLDTTLCGDWAGSSFSSDGCPGTCADYVKDPSNFATAQWDINYIAVYQSS